MRKIFLWTLIASLVLSALLGIYAFLFGDFGKTEVKILFTTLSLTLFSLTSLGSAAALGAGRARVISAAGLGLSGIGFVLFLLGIWPEWLENEEFWKWMILAAIWPFSFAQVGLLSFASQKGRARWAYLGTAGVILTLAVVLSTMVVFELEREELLRFLGTLGILDACGTITTPILARLTQGRETADGSAPFEGVRLECPRCGRSQVYALGWSPCPNCSLRIRVEVDG